MDSDKFKGLIVSGFLSLVFLIFLAFMAPYAYDYVQSGPDGINTSLSDVPGGALVAGLGFLLVMITLIIAVIIAIIEQI